MAAFSAETNGVIVAMTETELVEQCQYYIIRNRPVSESAFNNAAKAKNVTVAKGQRGDAGAVFDLASNYRLGVGPVSSKRWGDGGRKTGEENNRTLCPRQGCGFNSARSLRRISTDGLQFFPGSGDLPQSSAKVGAV